MAAATREYVVLAELDGGTYAPVGKFDAGSALDAIKRALANAGQNGQGTFVAVPERSWQPQTVKAQVNVRLTVVGETAAELDDYGDDEPDEDPELD